MKLYVFILLSLFLSSCQLPKEKKDQELTKSENEHIVLKKYSLKKEHYSLQYLDSWKIDSSDVDFDIDSYFTLSAPVDNGFVTFFIFNSKTDEKENVDDQIKSHLKKTMKNAVVTPFSRWGNYTGYGAKLKGKLLGVFKCELAIFSYSTEEYSFLVVSEYEDSEKEKVEPGLALIENTFKLKE